MRCPFCRKDATRVVDSRDSGDGTVIRRRRACTKCKKRFTTYESPEQPALFVIKKDGRRQPYDRERIRKGITIACAKRRIGMPKVDEVVGRVELEILRKYDREVPAAAIGELVMQELKRLDHVAYVRFASVYRDFQDVGEFMKELKPMMR